MCAGYKEIPALEGGRGAGIPLCVLMKEPEYFLSGHFLEDRLIVARTRRGVQSRMREYRSIFCEQLCI